MLQGKKIVLGITGSIAAYKACLLIRGLIKKCAEVQVVITPSGKEFITPLTLSTLTQKPVVSEFFSRNDGSWHSHVDLGLWADAMVIAPATASTIGKMANGIADNMLITTYLSMKAPVFVAPAMDLDMYAHPSTQKNLQTLLSYGNHIIEPGTGFLASKLEGKGRMEEPDRIIEVLEEFFAEKDLDGQKVLITAGPTYEKIDPVRFIGNYSSGKMGIALAEECARRGAIVELVCGPVQLTTSHSNIHRTNVESAQQMYEAATSLFPQCNAGILCAAVADFKPVTKAGQKIKREVLAEEKGELVLHLQPTQDIARAIGTMKRSDQVLVGFALETNDEETHAQEKLKKKNLDFIVLNSLRDNGAGFQHDTNKISIISHDDCKTFPLKKKTEVANDIINELVNRIKNT
ncbi:MAG: bifunctional phosphopantothenoylcysteine decarboxylase/phosphopantothenate--cysteine ligase CoaBC [Bacteroidaceae bacterium]|nr:bifunctional phosphopantothenoylcysteine decarboxylase/phosphopantothenate--cysteine ligase CoaBC [Bacteroidaceae bacterium]